MPGSSHEGSVESATGPNGAGWGGRIRTYTDEGDVVLDNAFGSGSFLVAAAIENRRFIGIERNDEVHLFKEDRVDYIEVAAARLAAVGVSPNVVRA